MMSLFNDKPDSQHNILPADGVVNYFGKILTDVQSDVFYQKLLNRIAWKNDEAVIYGKKILTRRKVAWYADRPFDYTYSKSTKTALPWTQTLLELKELVEAECNESFNSCLLNLYHDGTEGMAYHSDAEKDLIKNGAIASLSLGAERKFSFKHKSTGQRIDLLLENGSLLVMRGTTQSFWRHRLPPTAKINRPRINLTFRIIDA